MASSTVDQVWTTIHNRGSFCFEPVGGCQLTLTWYTGLSACCKSVHLAYPYFISNHVIPRWVSKTTTNSLKTFVSKMQWPSCLAFRRSWATIVLQQYVRNLLSKNSQYKVTNPVLATLWFSNIFCNVHLQPSLKGTSRKGAHNIFYVSPSCQSIIKTSLEQAGNNNKKSDMYPRSPQSLQYAQQQDSSASKFRLGSENYHCGYDECLDDVDKTESESGSCYQYQSDEEYEHCETDSCVSDDCVVFFDDSADDLSSHNDVMVPNVVISQTSNGSGSSLQYNSLFSEESGYYELQDESDQDSKNETGDESEAKQFEILWNTFEAQALSPPVAKSNLVSSLCFPRVPNKEVNESPEYNKFQEYGHRYTNSTSHIQDHCASVTTKDLSEAKHVTFKSDSELAVTHHIIAWSYAYRAARRGPWEDYARDRDRFARRIKYCASILEPCLSRKISQCTVR